MSNVDKTLVGSNFCGLACSEKNDTIHPQTCTSQVLKTHNSNFTLVDWINYKTSEESVDKTFQDSASLLDWLTTNYPIRSESIPIATDTTVGGMKLGENNEFLEVSNEGTLTFKSSALPTTEKASFETLGAIKLGNDSIMDDVEFNSSLYPITDNDYHCFPLVRDASTSHRAGIAIPKELFNSTQVQVNWNESDPTSLSYILNKPTIPEAYVLPMASDESLGGIKVGYASTENNKAVNINALGEAYIKLHTPKYTIINSGLSQHYFEITNDSTDDIYVPLFKIEGESKHAVLVSNIRFEIIGINNYSYYGEFMVNYHDCHDLLTIHLVGNNRLSQSDIIARHITSVNNLEKIIVYRKIANSNPVITDVFMVNILTSNVFDSKPVSITYYTNANSTDVDYDVNETSLNNVRDSDSMIVTTIPSGIPLINQPSN